MRISTFELGLLNSDDCSRLFFFFTLKLYFYQEKIQKDFFNSKGVGLGKESSNKNID